MKENINVKKLALSGMFIAFTVVTSAFYIPVGASKCFPVQHMVNVLSAVFLGPFYGTAIAFCTSLIRNLLGTGSLLAFPGSMAGALCCGLIYKYTKKLVLTYAGEIFGTGIIGGLLSFPVARLIMGNTQAALFMYVIPFLISTIGGTAAAALLVGVLRRTHVFRSFRV